MRSGRLNNFIIIEEPTSVTNEYGEEEKTIYSEKLRTRCDVINDSGSREVDNGEIFYSYTKTFILWDYFDKVLNEFDRIIYKGNPYKILSIELVKEDKLLYVRCEKANE